MSKKDKRKTVVLDSEVYDNLKQIAKHSGYTVQEVIQLAVIELLLSIGAQEQEEKPLIETGPGLIIPDHLK